jgi:hypothetical protein
MSTSPTIPNVQAKPKTTFMKCKELLPEHYYSNLSPNAQRLYSTIWNALNNYASDQIWITNAKLVERAHIRIEQLSPALSELSHMQLLEIVPGLIQNRYRITDPEAEPTQD